MRSHYIFACITTMLFSGCGTSTNPARPETAPASGIVTYQGQPVDQAIVVFSPQNHKFSASAVTDLTGRFELMAFPPQAGAVPGTYTVTILKSSQEDVAQNPGTSSSTAQPYSMIPARYSNPEQSGLIQEITAAGNTSIMIDLVD